MKYKKIILLSILLVFSLTGYTCTKFTKKINNDVLVARTLDLCLDLPYDIAVYPKGLLESGAIDTGKPIIWTSKYASIMVRELALPIKANTEGFNEKGLSVSLLYLDATKYEKRNINKPGIDIYKWAKYVLDNYATVDDVLKDINTYQIVPQNIILGTTNIQLPIHFSLSDITGDNAIIELIDGKMKIYHDKKYTVMANDPSYDKQLINLTKYKKTNSYNLENLPGGSKSSNRFVRASFYQEILPTTTQTNLDSITGMFSAISATFVPYYADYQKTCGLLGGSITDDVWPTQWATVSNLNQHTLYLIDGKSGNSIKVDMHKFNTNIGQPIRVLNPQAVTLVTDVSNKFIAESY